MVWWLLVWVVVSIPAGLIAGSCIRVGRGPRVDIWDLDE